MTHITYTYEIVSVSEDHRAMTILYTSPEHGTAMVGAPMPLEGETLDSIADMYSPVASWLTMGRAVLPVSVGDSGALSFEVPDAPNEMVVMEQSKLALAISMRDIPHGDESLWSAFKNTLSSADEDTQEDWAMMTIISREEPILVAILTTLLGAADAITTIDALYA